MLTSWIYSVNSSLYISPPDWPPDLSLIRYELRNFFSECISFTLLTFSADNGYSCLYIHVRGTIIWKLFQMELKVPLFHVSHWLVFFTLAWAGETKIKFTAVQKHFCERKLAGGWISTNEWIVQKSNKKRERFTSWLTCLFFRFAYIYKPYAVY